MAAAIGRRSHIIASLFLMAGLIAGILFQKYFGVGNLLPFLAPPPAKAATVNGRIEVPLSALSSQRLMVALTWGQSNAANHGSTLKKARHEVYNLYQGHLYVAEDPLLGATGNRGSVWTVLGDKLIEQGRYDAVVFIPIGFGGAHIARWTPTGDLHERLLNAIGDARASGLTITHLLWHQGESDTNLKTTQVQYEAMFHDMLAGIRAQGVAAPVYVSVASVCENEGSPVIRRAQAALVNVALGIYPGPDTDTLGPAYRRPDNCHFNDAGIDRFATLWLDALQAQ